MQKIHAWGVPAAGKPLAPMTIERREPGPHDVVIEIMFSGVCHSDIHQARDEWSGGIFPMVPGHEIVGRVTRLGGKVTRFKEGDLAGVGCMVDSCRTCRPCSEGLEQFCEKGAAMTYNGTEMDRKTLTYGGYSTQVVVNESFALRVPTNLDLAGTAPLLCAGITTYSPLRQFGCKTGDRVGVVGLGGLGHMAVKLAASMGAKVTVLSSSESKEADARRLGAADFVVAKGNASGALGAAVRRGRCVQRHVSRRGHRRSAFGCPRYSCSWCQGGAEHQAWNPDRRLPGNPQGLRHPLDHERRTRIRWSVLHASGARQGTRSSKARRLG